MIDEVICYIEEPPQLDCEIQTAKIEWVNEYKPYEGEYTYYALGIKDTQELDTKGKYLDDKITIVGHGLEPFSFPNPIPTTPLLGEEYYTVPASDKIQYLYTTKKYLDKGILIQPGQGEPVTPEPGGYEQTLDGRVLIEASEEHPKLIKSDIKLNSLQIGYSKDSEETDQFAIYIGKY